MSKNEFRLSPKATKCIRHSTNSSSSESNNSKWCIASSFPTPIIDTMEEEMDPQLDAYRKRLCMNSYHPPKTGPRRNIRRSMADEMEKFDLFQSCQVSSMAPITGMGSLRYMSSLSTPLPTVFSSFAFGIRQRRKFRSKWRHYGRRRVRTSQSRRGYTSTSEDDRESDSSDDSDGSDKNVSTRARKARLPWQRPNLLMPGPSPFLRAMISMRSVIRVAIVDDNRGHFERTKHPGPYNIKSCLTGLCHRPGVEGPCTGKHFFACVFLNTSKIRKGVLEQQKFDVLVFPGGSCKKQMKLLGQKGARQIEMFVTRGGGLVGVCAGAYTFSSRGLSLVPVRSGRPFHRGHGYTAIRFNAKGRRLLWDEGLGWKDEPEEIKPNTVSIRYHNGPALYPLPAFEQNKTRRHGFKVLAYYDTEISNNCAGPVEDELTNSAAITYSKYGQGSIVAIGPHPESTHHGGECSMLPGKPRMRRIIQRAVLLTSGRWKG